MAWKVVLRRKYKIICTRIFFAMERADTFFSISQLYLF
jgi:hypothetical protein